MNTNSFAALHEKIRDEDRDVALIAAPGMGVTTFIKSLEIDCKFSLIWIRENEVRAYWDKEYKSRERGKKFIIHDVSISALVKSDFLNLADISTPEENILSTTLPNFLKTHEDNIIGEDLIYLVLDGFDKYEEDLALIVCNELKELADYRAKPGYSSMRRIRYIIAGSIDFYSLYKSQCSSKSPATHFCKVYPNQFLLSPYETYNLIVEKFTDLSKSPSIVELIVDWSGGYIHYVFALSNWFLNEIKHGDNPTLSALATNLKTVIQERDKSLVYKYCFQNWKQVEADEDLLWMLRTALSVGYLDDASNKSKLLASLGFLVERNSLSGKFVISNKLVEFFVRERLSEMNMVLSLGESVNFIMPSINSKAHLLILEIETQLRNFIGDVLFSKHKENWVDSGLGVRSAEGPLVKEDAQNLQNAEKNSIYATIGLDEPLLSFLDFSDLGIIVKENEKHFSEEFSQKFVSFMMEINYYRKRVAHNRPLTIEQVNALKNRWQIIQKLMFNSQKKKS